MQAASEIGGMGKNLGQLAGVAFQTGDLTGAERLAREALAKNEPSEEVFNKEDEEKVKETIASTPMSSLTALLANSAIGRSETQVKANEALAKEKAKETPVPTANTFVIPFLNDMLAGKKAE